MHSSNGKNLNCIMCDVCFVEIRSPIWNTHVKFERHIFSRGRLAIQEENVLSLSELAVSSPNKNNIPVRCNITSINTLYSDDDTYLQPSIIKLWVLMANQLKQYSQSEAMIIA